MLKTEKVKIHITNQNRNYFKSKYDIDNDVIDVFVSDLLKNSGVKVDCLCDDCGKELNMSYQKYNKRIDKMNGIYCKKCIKNHIINPFSKEDVKKKIKKTLLDNYGVEHPLQNKEIKEKMDKTMIERHGTKHALCNEKINYKMKEKINSRTNDEWKIIIEKIISNRDQIKMRKKFEKTMLEIYGVKNALENKEIIDKMKEKINNRTEEEKLLILEKMKKTCIELYGEEFPSSNKIVMDKIMQTRINRGYVTDPKDRDEWLNYFYEVKKITRKNKKKLFENWDGNDYYDGEYIKEYMSMNSSNRFYPTIDHKISVTHGFKNGISPEEIGKIENLCITKKYINSSKGVKCRT